MDYKKVKLEVSQLYKRSSEFDFRVDPISACNPFGNLLESVTDAAKKAYDDILIESFNACGIDKETLMTNINKVAIRSYTYNAMDCTKSYDSVYYDGELLFKINKDFDYYEEKIGLKVEFL